MPVMALMACFALSAAPADQIHEAVEKGNLEEVKALIKQNPDLVKAVNEAGRTPLHLACRGTHMDVVDFLLEKGAVVDLRDHGGHSPLHHAAMSDRDKAAAALLKKGANVELRDDYSRTPLLLCARERGGPKTTAVLLKAGADVNAKDKFQSSSLELAAWRGKKEVVDLLLDAKAEIDPMAGSTRSLLFQATSAGLTRLFFEIVDRGVDPAFTLSSGGSLLHPAAAGGAVGILEILHSKSLDMNQKDNYGWTPIHYAARDGREDAVMWLMKQGAGIDIRTVMGQSPYNVAVERKFEKVRDLLASKGADTGPVQFPALKGDYMGQKPPGDTPQLFAPGIVSSIWGLHSTAVFSPDGNLALWAPMMDIPGEIYSIGGILMSERKNGHWTAPRWAPFSSETEGDVPFFSPDGKRLYFITTKPLPDGPRDRVERIWYVDRFEEGWSPARPVDPSVNDYPHHWQFSVDSEHDIYFSSNIPGGRGGGDIYVSKYVNQKWLVPASLGPVINTEKEEGMPFISPDGSYLLFSREYDLYISFRKQDGSWREAQNLGTPINSPSIDICPMITADGKYLFFVSQRGAESHAWWVDAGFIQRLRDSNKK